MEVNIENIADSKLKKDYKIIIPTSLVDIKVDEHVEKVKSKVSLKGFRKGQVPAEVVKEKYGKSIMAEESDKLINESVQKVIKDNNLKLALAPKVDVKIFEEGKDVEIEAIFEVYPEIPEVDIKKSKIVKRSFEVTAADLNESFEKLLNHYRTWEAEDKSYKAKKGDSVNIDYVGKIDKEEFEGGSAKGYQLEIGSKNFIDNFEDQLIGKKSGEEVRVKVKFPKDYHSVNFAGKAAEFDVKINEVLTAKNPEINDEFIKSNFGLESKEKLMEALKKQVEDNYNNIAKDLFKKDLFDYLNKKYSFDLPEGLVEEQFKSLWAQTEEELKINPDLFKSEKDKKKAENKQRETAERMIRCGMILSDLADKNKVEASNEDINQEISKLFSRYPGQEKQVMEYYQKNPSAIQQLKGSIIENKTIDFILGQDYISSKKATLKDLDKQWKKANEE